MENSYSIEELIDMLDDLINKSVRVPLGKCLVDADKATEILQDMRLVIPMEIQQAQKVVMDKNSIINEAKREAESIIRGAELRRAELLDESDIVREARRRAAEMMNAEQNRCADLRVSTHRYLDNMLQQLEATLVKDFNDLTNIRSSINGAQSNIQMPQQKSIQPMEKPGE